GGHAQSELEAFRLLYRKEYSVEFYNQLRQELVQQKEDMLLKQRVPRQEEEVLFEGPVLHFEDTRKWKERYVVVRASYSLECHDSQESFRKGAPPRQTLLPTGGTVVTTEERYIALVDQGFPDSNSLKEDLAPPVVGMPGQFPVYLHVPYRLDTYFCLTQEAKQASFLYVLHDCIRHQNQDFLRKGSVEVRAFLRALQLWQEEKGRYESWDMLLGSDAQVLANVIMAELLPKLKAKKTEGKRTWFAMVEEAHGLVLECVQQELSALKDACRTSADQQEGLLRSNMDQIHSSKTFLQNKLTARVSGPAEAHCSEHVQPHLGYILEGLMGPISLGFGEARLMAEAMIDQLCQDVQEGGVTGDLKQALTQLGPVNLQSCYQHVSSLEEQLRETQQRFSYTGYKGLVHSTQIHLQQLMTSVAYTFELLLLKALEDSPENVALAMEKAKQRVLKQYDYDSSTVRKKIFQKALLDITFPSMKKTLASTFKAELPEFDQYIFAEHADFVSVQNVYEDILLQVLEREISKVVKEAATMQKYNLFSEIRRDRFSQSSLYITPPGSAPSSPARAGGSLIRRPPHPASPLLGNGLQRGPSPVQAQSSLQEEEGESGQGTPEPGLMPEPLPDQTEERSEPVAQSAPVTQPSSDEQEEDASTSTGRTAEACSESPAEMLLGVPRVPEALLSVSGAPAATTEGAAPITAGPPGYLCEETAAFLPSGGEQCAAAGGTGMEEISQGAGASEGTTAHDPDLTEVKAVSKDPQPVVAENVEPGSAKAPDCVKEIRDLVVEVIEVEEVVQRCSDGSGALVDGQKSA
uniref:Niban 1/2/3 domain-containing protein n=1 Tax=Denticeps clupeoides TaxID=299321 RepID=A0AAY4CK84_9TELE